MIIALWDRHRSTSQSEECFDGQTRTRNAPRLKRVCLKIDGALREEKMVDVMTESLLGHGQTNLSID